MPNDQSVSDVEVIVDVETSTVEEVVHLNPVAGASSAAPASSGIPSAIMQQTVHLEDIGEAPPPTHQAETHMAGRTESLHQDTKP